MSPSVTDVLREQLRLRVGLSPSASAGLSVSDLQMLVVESGVAHAGISRVATGETDVLFEPPGWLRDGSLIGVVSIHGAGATGMSSIDSALAGTSSVHEALATRYPMVAADLGGPLTWGNATVQARITAAKNYLQGTLGAKSGPVFLFAISMGFLAAHNYARNNPGAVKGIIGSLGASNLTQMYGNPIFQASIGAAWGVVHPAALPAGADPMLNPFVIQNVNYYDSADTAVLPADVLALCAQSGGTAVPVSAVNHSEAAVAALPTSAMLAQLRAWE